MKRTWLWLEDEEDTVSELKVEVEEAVDIRLFSRIQDLTRFLISEGSQGPLKPFGLILDVMISSARAMTIPPGWANAESEKTVFTKDGYDAGLVFFERLILGLNGGETPFDPCPPVVFLTVRHTDSPGIAKRLGQIKENWAKKNNVQASHARVCWFRKWDVGGSELAAQLREWEGV